MTEEQLEWWAESTRRAVDKALAKYMKRSAVGFLLLFVGFLFNAWNNENQWDRIETAATEGRAALVESGDIIAVDGCNRDFRTTQALRGVLQASADFSRQNFKEGLIDQDQLNQRLSFYQSQLANLQPPDCRKTQGILTDDADHPLKVPEPLYPGSENNTLTPRISEEGRGGG
jgi:hypothetical protein